MAFRLSAVCTSVSADVPQILSVTHAMHQVAAAQGPSWPESDTEQLIALIIQVSQTSGLHHIERSERYMSKGGAAHSRQQGVGWKL